MENFVITKILFTIKEETGSLRTIRKQEERKTGELY
jgi:hypothetical protein